MNGASYFSVGCSSLSKKPGVCIFKGSQGDDEWNSNWRKNIEEINLKKYLRL